MMDLTECIKWIKRGSFKKICLQIPDHLMSESVEIILHLEQYTNASIFILGDTTYEYCCNDKLGIDHVGADAFIHFGHACLSYVDSIPTFYVFPEQYLNVQKLFDKFLHYFKDTDVNILLYYDVSYAYIVESVYTKLRGKYCNLFISTLECISNVPFTTCTNNCTSKILGRCCKLSTEKETQNFNAVFLGPANTTLLALTMSLPFYKWHIYHDFEFKQYNILQSLYFKRRNYLIEKIRKAMIFGVVIASLNITDYLRISQLLKQIFKQINKKVYLLCVGKINPVKLANFQEIDIFVVVSCPEASLINLREYFKPVVTPYEVDLAFNDTRIFSLLHTVDFKQILPGGVNYEKFKCSVTVNKSDGDICESTDNNSKLTYKSQGIVTNNQINTDFLVSRTWAGLEQKLGESNMSLAVTGRDGVPINYINECKEN